MITIENTQDIPQFRPNSKLCNRISEICTKHNTLPTIQVFRAKDNLDYRGIAFLDRVTLYWSSLETTDSMLWVFCHELRHVIINLNPKLYDVIESREITIAETLNKKRLDKMSVRRAYRTLYSIGLTETICDLFATEEIGKDYGDFWHSNRVKAKQGEKKCRK